MYLDFSKRDKLDAAKVKPVNFLDNSFSRQKFNLEIEEIFGLLHCGYKSIENIIIIIFMPGAPTLFCCRSSCIIICFDVYTHYMTQRLKRKVNRENLNLQTRLHFVWI